MAHGLNVFETRCWATTWMVMMIIIGVTTHRPKARAGTIPRAVDGHHVTLDDDEPQSANWRATHLRTPSQRCRRQAVLSTWTCAVTATPR